MTQDTTNKWTYTPPVKTLTPTNVYLKSPVTPEGYEIVAFRVPKEGEVIIAMDGNIMFDAGGHYTEPRFILAKLPEQPATAPEGYEFTGEYGHLQKNDRYFDLGGYAFVWSNDFASNNKHWILRPIPTSTLRDIYGTDSPVIPAGWESTGVVRVPAIGEPFLTASNSVITCASGNPTTARGAGQRLILHKKTEAVKPEPKFKVGDWVKGDSGYYSHIGMLARVDGWAEFEDGSIFHLHDLTPVAAPPAGFKYTKV